MEADKIRLLFTYAIAVLTLVGAFILIYSKLPEIGAEALLALVTLTLGFVLGFVFNKESAVGGARSEARAQMQGAQIASGHIPEAEKK